MKESCDCSLIKRLLKKRKNSLSTFSQCNNMNVNRLSTLLKGNARQIGILLEKLFFFTVKEQTKIKWETPKEDNAAFIVSSPSLSAG